jgi:hypothetical protein
MAEFTADLRAVTRRGGRIRERPGDGTNRARKACSIIAIDSGDIEHA